MMSESAHVFNHLGMSSSSENILPVVDQPPAVPEGTKRRQSSQQPRQLLSCTKCRERKVKCDRIKPCSACCARGASKECYFVAEGGDYAPIQQSYELRKLRAENLRLKERLRASKIPIEDDDSEAASPESLSGERPTSSAHKRRAARQRRFQGSEWSDSIYFGSPGLANVITDFASINLAPMSTQSLAHLMPRGSEMYTAKNPPPHPFATMFPHTPDECIPELLSCLRLDEAKDELFQDLDSFEKRVHICAFPYVPLEITKSEVERFLADPTKNAQMCPDMLALLFAALALGSQYSAWDKSGGQWNATTISKELRKGDVYIAASMQALRLASFMYKPTLLGIQALIMMGPFLTNSGRFLDAWTLFGTTIRLAHSIGLHRHPKYLDPAPPTQRECFIRQTLWWWMLHMDQEYSMTLGRPLGISGIGDCPPPHELTTDPHMVRFGEFVNHFTVLARQILGAGRLCNNKIDEFTDALGCLLETMPEMLRFEEGWLDLEREIPEWPLGTMAAVFYCKTHTYLILLNRQRIEKNQNHQTPIPQSQPTSYFHNMNSSQPPPSSYSYHAHHQHPSPTSPPTPPLRGRPLVLSSCTSLLTAFLFFHARVPAALICWTIGQQAFNSCMILLLDAMETGDVSRVEKVEKSYVVFLKLMKEGVHELAGMAVDRVSWGLARLGRMRDANAGGNVNVSVGDSIGIVRGGTATGGGAAYDVEMQGTSTGRNEAGTQGKVSMIHDTVMGNTGMLLLEDPGLQAFVPEAFQPLAWDRGVWDDRGHHSPRGLETSMQEPLEQETEKEQARDVGGIRGGSGGSDLGGVGGDEIQNARARSSERLRGIPQAPGSARRYTTQSPQTFHTPTLLPSSEPQGMLTSPTTTAMHHDIPGTTGELHQLAPPHLRHHSYPSLRQPAPPLSMSAGTNAHRQYPHHLHTGIGTGSIATSQLHLSTLPELTPNTTSASMPPMNYSAVGNPNVHPSWAARPAAPMSSLSEPAIGFVDADVGMNWQYDVPFHSSSASGGGWQYADAGRGQC
ncbi:hypothetical protein P280DRAFT_172683 [Massarina eburnea CBS 473.64]|uniref:Zn(2)-C6 fungal-type domain-containing protein n=1 Tax=Massarina eburnea CBS 473.64 TaxID=1395130 RepID=A0A6A6SCB6_9PLEO|nr:hypothetical protein P280DRAFT_172683 [Massarina eburnea CBS 473.64]